MCKRESLETALTAKLTTKGVELKSWNHTPELKIIKLPKNEGVKFFFFFTTSVERVRVKTKNYLHHEREKVFGGKSELSRKIHFHAD